MKGKQFVVIRPFDRLRACPVPDTGVNGFSLGVGLTWATEVRIAGFLVGGGIDGFLGLVAVGAGIGKQK